MDKKGYSTDKWEGKDCFARRIWRTRNDILSPGRVIARNSLKADDEAIYWSIDSRE